jgi:hypothetical protein
MAGSLCGFPDNIDPEKIHAANVKDIFGNGFA